jgi:hypothetical protein
MITLEKTYVIKMTINNEQIEELFKLYKYSMGEEKILKQGFTDYIKDQLGQFGTTDEFLIGDTSEYPELTENDLILLDKWALR